MSVEDAARAVTTSETTGSFRLWFGALGGAGAWLMHLVTNYSFEEWFACSPSAETSGEILGAGVATISIGVNVAFLALAVASAASALLCSRQLARAPDGATIERAQWMATGGLLADILFIAMIAWGFAPPLILGVCEYAP